MLAAEEVENLATLQSLADQIHADDATLTYTAHLFEGNDIGGIDVGFLVRSDVTINAVTQLGKNTQSTDGCGSAGPCPLNDRPPLLLDAKLGALRFAVLAIHNRSLSGIDEAAMVRASATSAWSRRNTSRRSRRAGRTNGQFALPDGDVVPNADATVPLVIVGDYNAFEFSDGYVDAYGQIAGTAIASQNLVWAPPITSPILHSDCRASPIQSTLPKPVPYSFVFDGYAQELDHVLMTNPAWSRCVRYSGAHGNADIPEGGPEATDPDTALRSADHDGFVIELRGNAPLPGTPRSK